MNNRIYTKGLAVVLIIALSIMAYLGIKLSSKEKNVVFNENIGENNAEEEKSECIFVDIDGAVKNPGVYELKDGCRVNDAIVMAGGLTDKAYTKNLNKARLLVDGEKIYVLNNDEINDNIYNFNYLLNRWRSNFYSNDINEYEIQEKFLWSNIIYVAGGDTVKMMDIWRDKQIDKYLKKASENNIILSGVSAGSICWFTKGHSDNNLRTNPEGWWDYTQAVGIDLIPAIHCPHYNEKGHQIFDEIMKTEELPGIAIENNCAIVIKDDMYRIIKSDNIRKAYLLKSYNGVVNKYELNNFSFSPISEIL